MFDAPAAPPSPQSFSSVAAQNGPAVTLRSVLLCALLLPPLIYWQISMEIVRNSTHPSTLSLPFHVVFVLLAVTVVNQAVRSLSRGRTGLRRGELLFLYSVLAVGSAVCGADMLQNLASSITYPFRYADRANNWAALIQPRLPSQFFLSDPAIYDRFYRGGDTVFRLTYVRAWLPVTLAWTVFIGLLLWVMLCMNAVLRRAWTEQEKLTYPIIQLPLQITQDDAFAPEGLFRARVFWVGFALAGGADMLNSLHVFFPAVPAVGVPGDGLSYFDLVKHPATAPFFANGPWRAIDWLPISYYPFVVGLGMLMPLDFLFSTFFFYWFWKLQKVAFVALAYDQTARFPYIENQAFGAYLSFCILSVWISRRYLRDVWRRAIGESSPLRDEHEPLPYRVAVFGGLGGVAGLVAMGAIFGLTWWVGIIFFVIYFALALAITRMRAELGTPVHDLHFTGPELLMTRVAGVRAFDAPNLTALGVFSWFNRAHRSHPMPVQLEAFKLAEQSGDGAHLKRWTVALGAFGIFAAFAGFWIYLDLMYRYGAEAQVAYRPGAYAYRTITSWLNNPLQKGEEGELTAIFVGFGIAALLQGLRVWLPWWPLHPLAYAITSSWQINLVWAPLTLAWIIKSCLLRFGGLRAFRASLPFFWGLMLGQFVVGGVWNIWGTLMNLPTYRFWD